MKVYGTAILDREKRLWTIEAAPHALMVAKRVFMGARSHKPGSFQVSHTPQNARDLDWFCSRYPLRVEPHAAMAEASRVHEDRIKTVEDYLVGHRPPERFDLAVPARAYQAQAGSIVLATGSLLLGDDLGLGKTCSAITILCDPRTLPSLVVAPAHLTRQWAREIARFAPSLTVHELKKGTPYELPDFFGRGPDVLIATYHKLHGWAPVLTQYCRSVIYDEIHELRRCDSMKYVAARTISDAMDFRLGLSATPVFNYGGEIFNILQCLRPGALGTKTEFQTAWCKGNYGEVLEDPQALGTYLRDAGLFLRRTRRDVGEELPPLTRVVEQVESDPAALREVEDVASKLAEIILGRTKASREEAFVAGGDLDWRLRQATGIGKAPHVAAFVHMLADSGEKILLVGWHHAVYEVWESRLEAAGIRTAKYTGQQSAQQKDQAIRRFTEGDAQVLILSLRAGAGIDGLQGSCSVVVFGELDWSPAVHEQVIGRLHRHGQDDPVIAYFLVAADGADPVMGEVLGLKREQADGIVDPHGLAPSLGRATKDHIKRLAEEFLARRGGAAPEGAKRLRRAAGSLL